jgi:hypothetical protein
MLCVRATFMKIFHLAALATAAAVLLGANLAVAAQPPVPAFTAHYRVLQNGSLIGKATLTLAPGPSGTWTFTTQSQGTAGLASLLDAGTREVSVFHWMKDLPQCDRYDYTLSTALKQRHRTVRCNWARRAITVDDKSTHTFAAEPGTLERHTVPLALAAGLAAGKTSITLPVAVRDRIEMQHYAARGKQDVTVPAGTFDATQVSRTDGGEGLEAWFAPAKLPVPVKIDQSGKQGFSLELESWSAR